MKKTLVLLLALAMLVPMALIPTAKAEVEKEPFYSLGWSDFDRDKYPYLEGLHGTSFSNIGEYARLGSMIYGQYTDVEVTQVAQGIKAAMDARPAGTRYWNVGFPSKILQLAPQDVLFLEHGVIQLYEMFSAVLKKLKELDCPLDGVIVDTELIFMGAWYIYADNDHSVEHYYGKNGNKNIYIDIVKNPKYAIMIRPMLEERGFPFWPNPDPAKHESEIFSICYTNKGPEYDQARNIWNTVMRIHINNYVNYWCYGPLMTYYPEATLSDYQSHDSKSWMKLAGITDDGVALSGGNSIRVGTASCFSYYYARPGTTFFNDHKQYASFNDGDYEASAFNGLLYDVNFTRHMLSSTDTKQIAPWITSYMYGGKKPASMAYTPYYTELLYHLGMFDPEPFLSYTYVNEYAEEGQSPSYTSPKYLKTQQVMNEIMAELTRVAGYADRKPIELPQYWNAEFVVSGMYANGRNIWRITPNGDEISLSAFKVKDSDPTFSVKGQTITFPGGKILDQATISEVGSHGYWVETKAGVNPVMTSDADRYEKYPSFGEDFDSYADGQLTPAKMKPSYAWSYNVSNGTATVKNKALALTGDVIFQNGTIPAKITAGDSYAEDQTWELKFTVPQGLSDSAQLLLLQYVGANMPKADGGIKIEGGKLYYSESGEYKELTAIQPGTYTVKRVMNFNDAKNFTYSLYLLDKSGKEVASVTDVACPGFTTITNISFSVKGADKAVLVDDYKLYPSGNARDFELYDAATGMNVRGDAAAAPRERSTAYRLSWLNGTDTAKTYTVTAAYYEGGKLKSEKAVKTVEMKPGHDGVETGVVDVAAGQSVKVYLKEGAVEEPTKPTTAPTKQTEASKATSATKQTSSTKATSATKATAPSKATSATKPNSTKVTAATKPSASKITQATKPNASKITRPTKPGETLAPEETLAPGETLAPTETLAPGETLAPTETLAPSETFAPTETLAPGETLAPTKQTQAPTEPEESEPTEATILHINDKGSNAMAKGNVILIVCSAILVLGIAGGACWYFFIYKKKATE